MDEGRLARLKAHVISREACAEVARAADLGSLLRARGEVLGADAADVLAVQPRVLAALTESVLGAAHVALGWERTRAGCVAAFAERLAWVVDAPVEPKTLLQEAVQRLGRSLQYVAVEETGPPHERTFTFAVRVDGAELGRASARSKKAAQGAAALAALAALEGAAEEEGEPCT